MKTHRPWLLKLKRRKHKKYSKKAMNLTMFRLILSSEVRSNIKFTMTVTRDHGTLIWPKLTSRTAHTETLCSTSYSWSMTPTEICTLYWLVTEELERQVWTKGRHSMILRKPRKNLAQSSSRSLVMNGRKVLKISKVCPRNTLLCKFTTRMSSTRTTLLQSIMRTVQR